MASVLVIEDDARIRQGIAERLAERGHVVESSARALEGLGMVVAGGYEVLVLDLGLPDVDGAEALRMVRAVSDIAVVVATARDEESEIIRLLDAGADDYLVKPFSVDQLEARIRAVLRRQVGAEPMPTLVVGELTIDTASHSVALEGRPIDLTPKEFELLAYLAERAGQMVGKREILSNVWRQPYGGADKTVDVHISWLRRKLGESASSPRYIHTRRGVGVVLMAPEE